MIAGIFHEGSGLGNQLARYVATRVLAADKGYEFAIMNGNWFKGRSFLAPYMGNWDKWHEEDRNVWVEPVARFIEERTDNPQGVDIRPYDQSILEVQDNTIIDGEFQDERYFAHRPDEVREWLKVEPLEMPDSVCVISFRGGEYKIFPDLFLRQQYWQDAIDHMRLVNKRMKFYVVTDDVEAAEEMFSLMAIDNISHEIGHDWRSIRYARYLILSNSSFGILPALLNQNVKLILAPKYWARHNVSDGYWAMEQNLYRRFIYLDRDGRLENYEECREDLNAYNALHRQ